MLAGAVTARAGDRGKAGHARGGQPILVVAVSDIAYLLPAVGVVDDNAAGLGGDVVAQ